MLLTEYDEKKHFRTLFREGKEEGIRQGREDHLREQIQKKLAKGKSVSEIAADLEEDAAVIEQLISSSHSEP